MKKGIKNVLFPKIYVVEKELRDHIVEWTATLLTMVGAMLNARLIALEALDGFTASFYIWSISNLLWIAFALKHRHWGVFVTFTVLLIINILAIFKNGLWFF